MDSRVRALGISWFREEDYLRSRGIMEDAWVLPPTYEAWKQKAEGTERKFKAEGVLVYRAIIDPDEFPSWCALRGLHVDAKARMAFASEFALSQIGQTH